MGQKAISLLTHVRNIPWKNIGIFLEIWIGYFLLFLQHFFPDNTIITQNNLMQLLKIFHLKFKIMKFYF